LDHAALCRRVASEISLREELDALAQEYEARALRLEVVTREAEDNVGASARTVQNCTGVLKTSGRCLQRRRAPCARFPITTVTVEGLMDDTKQNKEQSDRKKPVGEQITDFVAAAAGALAETAVKSVAKRVRKATAKKTPEPVKKAVKSVGKASKASQRTAKRGTKKVEKRAKKSMAKKPSKKRAGNKAKKSKSRR
jgi:hypothetical protein